ncbi:TfoX/Sxy family DNA transformation protein [Aliivibrio kagoshimensis]|jgi:DNA transformation protein|uniref:TfoX/Sxy family DNA transformation protein n=1 Tax=Aliivibrio kagoshimensis TaxID=2910230 RepID=UPI003D1525AA
MDRPLLKDSLKLFSPLGKIKSRSMFGGFGIFADDTMFALIVNDKLHLRADKVIAKRFVEQGLKPYVYKKRGFPVVTKYFAMPDEQWSDINTILVQAKQSLLTAKEDKVVQETTGPNRLKDLPNLRLGTERMLKKAGISTIEQLRTSGSLGAYQAIKSTHNTAVSVELLWALEGAICGKHWSVIPQSRRDELLVKLN